MAKTKKHLTKSKDKVFLGVFGGIADYFGLDETLVRIIGISFSSLPAFPA